MTMKFFVHVAETKLFCSKQQATLSIVNIQMFLRTGL